MAALPKLDLITLSVPLFFSGVLAELAFDRAKRRGLYQAGDTIASIGTGVLDQVCITVARATLFTAPYLWLYAHARLTTFDRPTPLVLVFGLLLADFGYYWAHRFTHEVSVLWVGHVAHHSSEQYNLSTALRQNGFASWFLYMFNMPMAIAGIAPPIAALIIPFIQLYQFWIHTRAIPKLGAMELVFNTPSHHRVHHGINPEYVDRNYGAILIVWDRLFGTFAEERAPVVYGVLKPLRSFNPARAWIEPWVDLARAARSTSWRAWYKPPGWDVTRDQPPDIKAAFAEATASRFAPAFTGSTRAVAVALFVAILALASTFLFVYPRLPHSVAWPGAAALLAAVAAFGSWLDFKTG